MKKCIFISLLALLVLAGSFGAETKSVFAYTSDQLNNADALFSLGLIQGSGVSYDLDNPVTREQAVTILIRLLGKEEEALSKDWKHPFPDVNGWAERYIGYAYQKGLAKGTDKGTFEPLTLIDEKMFCTFCLRALSYDDGENKDFLYRDAATFANGIGVLSGYNGGVYKRANAIEYMVNTLACKIKGSTTKLYEKMVSDKQFTKAEYEHALEIKELGRTKDDPTGETSMTDVYREEKTSSGGGGGASGGGGGGGAPSGGGGGNVTPPHTHTYENGVCTGCGEKDPNYKEPMKPEEPVIIPEPYEKEKHEFPLIPF